MKETLLYAPIRAFLQQQGYAVQAEVRGCDIAATKNGDLIVVEMKTAFNATLLIQATERQKYADAVYVAIPAPGRRSRNWRGMCHLLKRLELGLILIHHPEKSARVEIQFHPDKLQKRRSLKKRRVILEEINGRSGDYNVGGSNRISVVTAYREQVIRIAWCLEKNGPLSTRQLRAMGTSPKTTAILNANFYGWFVRVERGVYALGPLGKEGLKRYPQITQNFKSNLT